MSFAAGSGLDGLDEMLEGRLLFTENDCNLFRVSPIIRPIKSGKLVSLTHLCQQNTPLHMSS